ncbi:unnamed protein product [Allacma fusca]|uniref:PPM-type phosphatase domain-containing protein n=1 Tax=Allacma fusca TaxID=39272 RepID=A0A8J2LUB2_9HEXA|nr:unnamed protein product [Allacma fusca]
MASPCRVKLKLGEMLGASSRAILHCRNAHSVVRRNNYTQDLPVLNRLKPRIVSVQPLMLFSTSARKTIGASSTSSGDRNSGVSNEGEDYFRKGKNARPWGGRDSKNSNGRAGESEISPAAAAASWNTKSHKRRQLLDFDAFGTWDSTMDLPLLVEASIAQGIPIPEVIPSSIGMSTVRGRRPTQEDQCVIEQLAPNILYWAVFDGHGGSECSKFCAQQMHRHVAYWLDFQARESSAGASTESDLATVLYNAFQEVNNSFAKWYASNRKGDGGDSSGTTATVVLLKDSTKLAIAHVGDSRAIICRGGEARKLTTDHIPSLITEKIRIEKSGGKVSSSRVNERLAMTRSIGDLELKRFGVIAEPEIRIMDINHSRDAFVVLTTDGINNVMTDSEIIETVKQAEDPTIAAHLLTDTAVQYSSEDNSTAIVTPLGSWGKYSAAATIFHSFGKSFTSSSRFS